MKETKDNSTPTTTTTPPPPPAAAAATTTSSFDALSQSNVEVPPPTATATTTSATKIHRESTPLIPFVAVGRHVERGDEKHVFVVDNYYCYYDEYDLDDDDDDRDDLNDDNGGDDGTTTTTTTGVIHGSAHRYKHYAQYKLKGIKEVCITKV